jgi:hypothetical protein
MKRNKRKELRTLLAHVFDLRQQAHALEQEAIALRAEIEADSRAEFEQKRLLDAIRKLPPHFHAELMRRASEI